MVDQLAHCMVALVSGALHAGSCGLHVGRLVSGKATGVVGQVVWPNVVRDVVI